MRKVSLILLSFFLTTNSVVYSQLVYIDSFGHTDTISQSLPNFSFDTARFSNDGQFAFIYKNDFLRIGNRIPYWTLYEKGKNKILNEYFIVFENFVFEITYEKDEKVSTLILIDELNEFKWGIKNKFNLDEFVEKYNLTIQPLNKTQDLIVEIDTIPSLTKRIPNEKNLRSIGDSIDATVHIIELSFYYKEKLIHREMIKFLPDPSTNMFWNLGSTNNIDDYLELIREDILIEKSPCEEYGRYFLVYEDIYFLSFKIQSVIFTGYEIVDIEGNFERLSGEYVDESAHTRILGKLSDKRE